MMLRSFIAIEIPAGIQDAIARSTASIRDSLLKVPIRWVASRNMHLTLKFLGDVSSTNLEQLAETLKMEAALHESFSMSVGGLGAFPNPRRARVLWVGLQAPPTLQALYRGVEAVASRLGYVPEERPFSPHLTIGRVSQNATPQDLQHIHAAVDGTTIGALGTFQVEALHIFKSDLQPGGAVYTHLYRLPMKPFQNQSGVHNLSKT